jgi:hypothetical protein
MNQRLSVHDIKRGSTFRFNNQTWKVTEVYKYRWDDDSTTTEFQIKNQEGNTLHLEIDLNDDDQTVCIVWTDIPYYKGFFGKRNSKVEKIKFKGKSYPKILTYDGIEYLYFNESHGTCTYGFYTESVSSLSYASADKRNLVSLEIWEDDGEIEKELAVGEVIDEASITHITEGKKGISDYGFIRTLGKNILWVVLLPFIFIIASIDSCSNKNNSWNSDDPYYQNDSTKVNRTNRTYYRNRNSRGYGK